MTSQAYDYTPHSLESCGGLAILSLLAAESGSVYLELTPIGRRGESHEIGRRQNRRHVDGKVLLS